MKLPDPRPCVNCGEIFQPKFRAHTTKYCPKPECQEANNSVQKERCRAYREQERAKGELKSLDRQRKKAKREPNGWTCEECGKPLHGPYRWRHPGACQVKCDLREQRTDGAYLFLNGDDWQAIGDLRGRDALR